MLVPDAKGIRNSIETLRVSVILHWRSFLGALPIASRSSSKSDTSKLPEIVGTGEAVGPFDTVGLAEDAFAAPPQLQPVQSQPYSDSKISHVFAGLDPQ